MTWQRVFVCAALLVAGLIVYAPYEWGTEVLRMENDVARSTDDNDRILRNRMMRILVLRQTYPIRQRQFIFGGETRVVSGPYPITIQRKLVIEQLALECLLAILLVAAIGLLFQQRHQINLKSPITTFNGLLYVHAVTSIVDRLKISDPLAAQLLQKVNLVVQSHISKNVVSYVATQREVDELLSQIYQTHKRLPSEK